MTVRRFLLGLFLLLILAGGAGISSYYYGLNQYWQASDDARPAGDIFIASGTPSGQIIAKLQEAGLIRHPQLFKLYALRFGHLNRYQAGEYAFPPGLSPEAISKRLVAGETIRRSVTVPEGWLSKDIVTRLRKTPFLAGSLTNIPPEGSLLPETYFYTRGQTRKSILKTMQKAMEETLAELWHTRASGLPFSSPQDALILASIIEKETGMRGERRRVAGVFVNRLRRGMKLQSDPTVNYAMYRQTGELKTRLLRADLDTDSPFNTYQITGLPPAPICNPGRASMKAALNPASTNALYFVADGKGGHVFAETLKEHNRNVQAYYRTLRD